MQKAVSFFPVRGCRKRLSLIWFELSVVCSCFVAEGLYVIRESFAEYNMTVIDLKPVCL